MWKVLWVEDQLRSRDVEPIIKRLMQNAGSAIEWEYADSLFEAFRKLKNNRFDLITTDIKLPWLHESRKDQWIINGLLDINRMILQNKLEKEDTELSTILHQFGTDFDIGSFWSSDPTLKIDNGGLWVVAYATHLRGEDSPEMVIYTAQLEELYKPFIKTDLGFKIVELGDVENVFKKTMLYLGARKLNPSFETKIQIISELKGNKEEYSNQFFNKTKLSSHFPYIFTERHYNELEEYWFPPFQEQLIKLAKCLDTDIYHGLEQMGILKLLAGEYEINDIAKKDKAKLQGWPPSRLRFAADSILSSLRLLDSEISEPFVRILEVIASTDKHSEFIRNPTQDSVWFLSCLELLQNYIYWVSPRIFIYSWALERNAIDPNDVVYIRGIINELQSIESNMHDLQGSLKDKKEIKIDWWTGLYTGSNLDLVEGEKQKWRNILSDGKCPKYIVPHTFWQKFLNLEFSSKRNSDDHLVLSVIQQGSELVVFVGHTKEITENNLRKLINASLLEADDPSLIHYLGLAKRMIQFGIISWLIKKQEADQSWKSIPLTALEPYQNLEKVLCQLDVVEKTKWGWLFVISEVKREVG